jgi:hypothetical protein
MHLKPEGRPGHPATIRRTHTSSSLPSGPEARRTAPAPRHRSAEEQAKKNVPVSRGGAWGCSSHPGPDINAQLSRRLFAAGAPKALFDETEGLGDEALVSPSSGLEGQLQNGSDLGLFRGGRACLSRHPNSWSGQLQWFPGNVPRILWSLATVRMSMVATMAGEVTTIIVAANRPSVSAPCRQSLHPLRVPRQTPPKPTRPLPRTNLGKEESASPLHPSIPRTNLAKEESAYPPFSSNKLSALDYQCHME